MTTKSDRNVGYAWLPPGAGMLEAKISGLLPNTIEPPELVLKDVATYNANRAKMGKEAIKDDSGKVDWTLVPFEALEDMVKVLEFGAKKYDRWNWTTGGGFKWTRILGSLLRHIFAFMRGEDTDPESGLSHISHAQCNLLFLAYYIRNKNKYNNDDRQ